MSDKKVFVRINSKLKDSENNNIAYDSKIISTEDAKEYITRFEDSVYKGTTFYLELIRDIAICIPVSEINNIMIYPERVLEDE